MPGPDPADSDEKILRLIALRKEPFATASMIEPELSVGTKQTKNRMDDLVDDGFLDVELVGRTNVYWLTDEGRSKLTEANQSETDD